MYHRFGACPAVSRRRRRRPETESRRAGVSIRPLRGLLDHGWGEAARGSSRSGNSVWRVRVPGYRLKAARVRRGASSKRPTWKATESRKYSLAVRALRASRPATVAAPAPSASSRGAPSAAAPPSTRSRNARPRVPVLWNRYVPLFSLARRRHTAAPSAPCCAHAVRAACPAAHHPRHGRLPRRCRSSPCSIPLVLQWIVDEPLASGDTAQLWPAVAIVLALGIARGAPHRAAPRARADPRHPRRGGDAQQPLREAAGPAGGVPRPLAERAAALARDERPRADPALARLRCRAAGRQLHRDRDRLRDPVHLVVAARPALPGLLDPALDLRLPLRAAVLDRRSALAGPAGRPRDRRRGIGARHPGSQGVRARHALAGEVPRPGGRTARHRDREGAHDRVALALAAAGAGCRLRALAARWRAAGRERRDDGRAAVRVLRDGDRSALADRVDRVAALDDLRDPHRRRPAVRGARRAEPDPRPGAARRLSEPHGPAAASTACTSATRTRRRTVPRHPRRRRPRARAGGDDGARRPHRVGQDDADRAHDPAVRRDRRRRAARRRRRARPDPRGAAPAHRDGLRGRDPVLGVGA